MDDGLVSEEVLGEAETAFKSHFRPETRFEKQIVFVTHDVQHHRQHMALQRVHPHRIVKRTAESILAEALLCKQLGWDTRVKAHTSLYPLEEVMDMVRAISAACDQKCWLNAGVLTGTELEVVTPFVEGVIASVGSVNKGVQKRSLPKLPLTGFMTMFSEARKIKKGITIILGMGERLDDMEHLFRFIETNHIDRVMFRPFKPARATRYFQEPSSFYCARWIAETRIRFPNLLIVAGTGEGRVAETGLFVKAGANTITNFPIIRLFNSEQARVLEEEVRNAGRTLQGTLTNVEKLTGGEYGSVGEHVRQKLEKYMMAMRNASR